MCRTDRRLGRDERGVAMVTVVLVSSLIMSLVVLALTTGDRAQVSSARDRNFDLALALAEAGVQEGIAKVEASAGTFTGTLSNTTPHGSYTGTVTRSGSRYVIDVTGSAGGDRFGRTRRVQVTLDPPGAFPYALFSETAIEIKNNSTVNGGVWANDSVLLQQNDIVDGSVIAATSWIQLEQGARVKGDAWSGGFNASGTWAIDLKGSARIDGWAKASVSQPADPITCGGEAQENYDIDTASGVQVGGNATTWGVKNGPGSVTGTLAQHLCTAAATPKPIPPFTWNPNNYASVQEFSSVSEFQTWLAGNASALTGVLKVDDPAPGQSNRIDLTGVTIAGDVTIVTNAPVFTNGITDGGVTTEAIFVLVSHYEPPVGTSCSIDHDSSECAIHVKNNFSTSCKTAVLIYADLGPVAVKNNLKMCGTITANSILIKNNQELDHDPRIARVIGFGNALYEVSRWEELGS